MTNAQNRQSVSVNRYANALFQLAKEAKVLDSISSDLEKIKKFLLSDSDIASFIENSHEFSSPFSAIFF